MEALKRTGRVCTAFLNFLRNRIFGFLKDASPYQPELSLHALLFPPLMGCVIGIYDIMHPHNVKDDIIYQSEAVSCLSLIMCLVFWRMFRSILQPKMDRGTTKPYQYSLNVVNITHNLTVILFVLHPEKTCIIHAYMRISPYEPAAFSCK